MLQDYVAFHLKVRRYVFEQIHEFETDVHFHPPAVLHRTLGAT